MPSNGTINIMSQKTANGNIQYLDCKIENPSLSKRFPKTFGKVFEQIKQWQREIIGEDNISEFFTETTGQHWKVFLKRKPLTFLM